jgi:LDH2 family malate/lactate/ureidoglycolate dehydrogenase
MAVYPRVSTDRTVRPEALRGVVRAIFARCGMNADDAATLADALIDADLRGIHSHGVLRVPDYVKKLTEEGVDPKGRPVVVSSRGGAILVDGRNSMGQIGGVFAMRAAIERARTTGIALATVRNSNHCGAMDRYVALAVEAGMIGLAGTNAIPTMAPWGGLDRIVGINPLAVGFPAKAETPVLLDFAFGATAHGKIRVYAQKGMPLPADWVFGADGEPTTDPIAGLTGLIQPIGQHKGVGLGMAIGMLSTLLSGAGYGTELGSMEKGPIPGRDGHFFVAIDPGFFLDPAEFRERVDAVVRQVHASRRKPGVEALLVPGEIEAAFAARHARDGIPLAAATYNDVVATAERFDVDASALAGSAVSVPRG